MPLLAQEYAKLKIYELKYRLKQLKDVLEYPRTSAQLNQNIVAYINGSTFDQFGREVKDPNQKSQKVPAHIPAENLETE